MGVPRLAEYRLSDPREPHRDVRRGRGGGTGDRLDAWLAGRPARTPVAPDDDLARPLPEENREMAYVARLAELITEDFRLAEPAGGSGHRRAPQ